MKRSRFFAAWMLALCLGCSRTEHSPLVQAKPIASVSASASASSPSAVFEPPAPIAAISARALIQKITSSGQRGVIVNAWAAWCQPCREELPMLARLGPKLAEQGVPIWLVSIDDPSAFVVSNALLDSLRIPLRRFGAAPPLEAFKAELSPEWRDMIPVSFLFDGAGKLRYFWTGALRENDLLPVVSKFLAGKPLDDSEDGVRHP